MAEQETPPKMTPQPDAVQSKAQSKTQRSHRWALWAFCLFAAIMVGISVTLYSVIGRPIDVPDWLHQRLETRFSNLVPDQGQVQFGGLTVEVNNAGRPRVTLRDVTVTAADGAEIVTVQEVDAGFAAGPLLQGKLRLGRLRLSGAEVLVRRRKDGSFDLAFGVSLPEVEQSASVSDIVAGLDQLLLSEELSELSQIDADALILRVEDLRAGRAWTIDGGRLRMDRDGDDLRIRSDLAVLGGHDYVTSVEMNFESTLGNNSARFGMTFEDMPAQDIAVQTAAVAWLDVVQAPISGALRGSVDGHGNFGAISGTLQIAEGAVQPDPSTRPIPFKSARSYFTYDPETQNLAFDEISVDSPWLQLNAQGWAQLQDMDSGLPQQFTGQFSLSNFLAHPDDLVDEPLTLDQADMSFQLALDPFEFRLGELILRENGEVITLSGEVGADAEGWHVGLKGQSLALSHEVVLSLWPKNLGVKARDWVSKNIYDVDLSNVQFAFRSRPDHAPDVYAGFEFSNAEVKFSKKLPPIQNGSGQAALHGNRFAVRAEGGHITPPQGGQIDVTGTRFTIPDVRKKPTPSQVDLNASAQIEAALSLLNLPPLSLMDKAGLAVDVAAGRAQATGTLNLPLKKKLPFSEVEVNIAAKLRDVVSDRLVKTRNLRAAELDLRVADDLLTIGGVGRLDGILFDGQFRDDLRPSDKGRSAVSAEVTLDPQALRALGIALPAGAVSGQTRATLDIQLVRGQPPAFTLRSDLKGLGLAIDAVSWRKPQSQAAVFEVTGTLGTPVTIDAIRLEAIGLSAEGRIVLTQAGALDQIRLDRVQIADWLDAPVTLVGRGAGRPLDVRINGGRLDMRNLPNRSSRTAAATSGPTRIDATLDRVQITRDMVLTGFAGQFTSQRGLSGSFVSRVNGGPQIAGTLSRTSNGRSQIEVTAQDAGAALSAAKLLKLARQGSLTLVLTPVDEAGTYDGNVKIERIRLVELPVLSTLLNAVSIVGLLDQLSGPGILFSEVEAQFRLTPDQLIVQKSSAIGASVGISLDGRYDLKQSQLDFQGVLSPIYAVNAIGAIFTRKGEGLLGFNFNIKGDGESPRVTVNPLSIFTPGMFREIFRRPAPNVDATE